MGFIAYQVLGEADRPRRVRILMECQQESQQPDGGESAENNVSYAYAVDVQFIPGQPGCTLQGIEEILSLKKFYKVVAALEERAREHGNDRQSVFASAEALIEHLDYTRNTRRLPATARVERRYLPAITASYQEDLNSYKRNFTGI